MSYFEDASLVLIPSAQKLSKIYSVKPTDGTGDLTFTRSNDTATRVNSAGLIEKVRTNLVPNGLLFNGATGVLYTTVTSDSPISGVSSTRITKNEAAGTLRYANQTVSASVLTGSISYTISRYFKYDGYNLTTSMEYNSSLNWGGTSWVQGIDIASTGVTLQAPSNCTSKITNVGNGWYRVDVTIVNGASPIGNATHLLKVASTLSTGQGFLTAAPQLETGDIATDYIATTSAAVSVGPVANVPRLDYLNSSCPRLLLEPQRTSLVTFSESFDNGIWNKVNSTVTSNAAVSPDGYTNADQFNFNASSDSSCYQPLSGSSAAYSISIFAKYVSGGKYLYIFSPTNSESAKVWFDIEAGTVANQVGGFTGAVQDYGNGWYRCTLTNTSNKSLDYMQFGISSTSSNRTLSASSVTYFYGAQVEAGAYATSYIPTLGAAVTRGADSTYEESSSALIGQTEGTLFAQFKGLTSGAVGASRFSISSGTSANWIFVGTESNNIRGYVRGSNSVVLSDTSVAITGNDKVAIAYKTGSIALYINGVQIATSSSTLTFNAALDDITTGVGGSYGVDDTILFNQVIVFPTRLSNADLAALTA